MADPALTLVTEKTLTDSRFISGTVTPNGAVTAAPGSIYHDTAKNWDVATWIKAAGTGNTGWEVLRASAIPRSLIALSTTPVTSGDVRYIRSASAVTLTIDALKPTAAGTLTLFTNNVLSSIAPPAWIGAAEFRVGVANNDSTRRAKIDQNGVITIVGVLTTDALYGSVTYQTTKAWAAPLGTVLTS
jgi:hypothetical protein